MGYPENKQQPKCPAPKQDPSGRVRHRRLPAINGVVSTQQIHMDVSAMRQLIFLQTYPLGRKVGIPSLWPGGWRRRAKARLGRLPVSWLPLPNFRVARHLSTTAAGTWFARINSQGPSESGAQCWRKPSVREISLRRMPFKPGIPIRSQVFVKKIQQSLNFRCQAWLAEEKGA